MKKIKNYLLVAMVALTSVTFVGCEKENNDGGNGSGSTSPTLVLDPAGGIATNTTVSPGAELDFTVVTQENSTSKSNIKSLVITRTISNNPTEVYRNDNVNSDNFTYTYSTTASSTAGTESYKFVVTDRDDKVAEKTIVITVSAGASNINTFTAKMAGGQSNASLGSFFSSKTGQVYKIDAAKSNSSFIDVVYYYGQNNEATLGSPDAGDVESVYGGSNGPATWNTQNDTRFTGDLGAAAFDDADNSLEITTAVGVPLNTQATDLSVGDVIGFDSNGKKGLIKVTSISGQASGSITFSVKVQQ